MTHVTFTPGAPVIVTRRKSGTVTELRGAFKGVRQTVKGPFVTVKLDTGAEHSARPVNVRAASAA